jgi:hypothetical protein
LSLEARARPPRRAPLVCVRLRISKVKLEECPCAATGHLLDLGGPGEFAAATEEQRARIAASAKDLGIKATQ